MTTPAFVVRTCEAAAETARGVPFTVPTGHAPFSPFETGDPFGLRKAVLPVFERQTSGAVLGLGTAFHVDGWGGYLTAEHVIVFLRDGLPANALSPGSVHELDARDRSHAVLLLGIGLVFGQVAVPDWAFAPVIQTLASVCEREDPIAEMRGKSTREVALDVAGLFVSHPPAAYRGNRDPPKTIPAQLSPWSPAVGEHVLAFGYPELKPSWKVSSAALRTLIEDGLFAAYGRVTRLFPTGRDRMNRTPGFEVEADWPSGMSGGPIVNESGAVIGLVSRSLAPYGGDAGIGYAACLPWIPEVRTFAPRVDPHSPGWRLGFAVRDHAGHVQSIWPTRERALRRAASAGHQFSVIAASHRIGSNEYMFAP